MLERLAPAQLCCTSRLLAEFGLKPSGARPPSAGADPLAVWYGDLFYEQRRKCVVLMNAATGYVAFELFTKREKIRLLPQQLPNFLAHSLDADGFSMAAIDRVVRALSSMEIRRTADRSTLGHIVQVRKCAPYEFDRFYEMGRIPGDLEFGKEFNHGVYGPRWDPVQALADMLGEHVPPRSERYRVTGRL